MLYELISNNHKILPHGHDFYCMCSYSLSGKICFYIFIAHALSSFPLSLLYPYYLPSHVISPSLLSVPSLNNQLKNYFNIFPDVHVLSKSKHTHSHALAFTIIGVKVCTSVNDIFRLSDECCQTQTVLPSSVNINKQKSQANILQLAFM